MDNPIRVAFDHRTFSVQSRGGISRYFTGIVPLLAENGVDARIYAPLHHNAFLTALPQKFVFGNRIPTFKGSRRLALAVNGPISLLAMARFAPQIVHETYFGLRREAPKRSKLVLTIYDMIHELFSDQLGDPETREAKAAAIARADLILCISENTRRDLIRFFPNAESRARTTYLGFDANFGHAQERLAIAGRPYLLHVGPRWAYKNFRALLDAFASSPQLRRDFELVCIGGGPFDSDEAARIAQHGLGENVRQYEANDEQLRQWYASAALFVYPSLYEGFGIPPLEAMAANCPVVAVKTSSLPEVCGNAAELAASGSAEALRASIEAVVYNAMRVDDLRKAGLRQIAKFSWSKTARDTAACYRELL